MHALAWFFPFFRGLFLGIVAMVFHEAGHLIAAPLVGIKIKTIGLEWKGLYTVREPGSPGRNLIVSLAGPLANLALLALWPLSREFGIANLCFAFFNMLPIEGSDGQRVLRCWGEVRRDRRAKATTKPYTAYSSAAPAIGPKVHLVSESTTTPE